MAQSATGLATQTNYGNSFLNIDSIKYVIITIDKGWCSILVEMTIFEDGPKNPLRAHR